MWNSLERLAGSLMASGVRQGCPANDLMFAMAFEIFSGSKTRTSMESCWLDFPQPVQCSYADDLAVAAPSLRDFITALAPAFHSVDPIAGLFLNELSEKLSGATW